VNRVGIEFDGASRGAVTAAKQTQEALQAVGRTASREGRNMAVFGGGVRDAERDVGKLSRGALAGSGIFRSFGRSLAFASAGFIGGYGITAAVRGAANELSESVRVAAQTRQALRSTGGQANVTARQIDQLANSLLQKTGVDDEAIKSGENLLLTFTRVRNEAGKGNDVFNQTTRAALDMSAVLGQDLQSSVLQLGKALNDPVTGMTALRRVGVLLTKDTQEQIKTLVQHGKLLEAQKIILREVTTEFGGQAAAQERAKGGIDVLRESVRNLSADFLRGLLPSVRQLIGSLQRSVNEFASNKQAQARFRDTVIGVAKAIGQVIGVIRTVVGLLGGLKNTLVVLVGAWAGFKAAGIASALAVRAANIAAAFGVSTAWKAALVSTGWGALAIAAGIAASYIITHWSKVKGWFATFWDYLKRTGNAAFAALKEIARAAVYAILQYATAAIRGLLKAASYLPVVGGKAKAALNEINDYLRKWKPDFANVRDAFAAGGASAGRAFNTAAQQAMTSYAYTAQQHGATVLRRSGTVIPATGGQTTRGSTGPITPGLAAVERLTGARVNDDFATSGHAKHSYHYRGQAADLAVDRGVWNKLFAHRQLFAELFGPWGLYHYGVRFFDATLQRQHMDHIHVAYTGGPEAVTKALSGRGGGAGPRLVIPGGGGAGGSVPTAPAAAVAGAAAGAGSSAARTAGGSLAPVFGAITSGLSKGVNQISQATRTQIGKWKKTLTSQIEQANEEAKRAFERTFSAATTTVFRQFDRVTELHVRDFNRQTEQALTQMRRGFEQQLAAFDAETQRGLARLAAPAETPAERALRQFREARDAEQRAKERADAIAAGDTERLRQLDLDDQERALQQAADASRKAADEQAAARQAAYQQQRDQLRQALEDQEALREQAFQDQRDAELQAWQEHRDDQRTQLQNDLDDWQAWIDAKKKSWAEFIAWLLAQGFTGISAPSVQRHAPTQIFPPSVAPGAAGQIPIRGPFQAGGKVGGAYIGREDTVLAQLTPGEYVIDRRLTRALEDVIVNGSRTGGDRPIVVEINLDGRRFARAVARPMDEQLDRRISYQVER